MAVATTAGRSHHRTKMSPVSELFHGRLRTDLVQPFPERPAGERARVSALVERFRDFARDGYDPLEVERRRGLGDQVLADLGARGLTGLHLDERYGGQGLSQTGYFRVFEAMAEVDPGLAIVLGIHQSIGMRGIVLYGTDEQKQRLLPDLAAGRKLAGFALTEDEAGSDAYQVRSRAVREADGAWRLNGEKRFVGNGSTGSVFVVIARAQVDGRDRHVALIVERGMPGFEVGERYDMLGVHANDVRRLRFNEVRVPPENLLGEPGQGFKIAMQSLNNGRLGLAAVSVGAAKALLDRVVAHLQTRRQFGVPLAELEMVREKVAWATATLFARDATCYLTSGLLDQGFDVASETAACKVACSEFVNEVATTTLQLRGGEGYMQPEPYEKFFRDVRVFPVFEGANDVLRAFVAMSALRRLPDGTESANARPAASVAPVPELASRAEALRGQAERFGAAVHALLERHGPAVIARQFQQRRVADALIELYAQMAVLSVAGSPPPGRPADALQGRMTVARAAFDLSHARAERALHEMDDNEDERTIAVADLAYRFGPADFALARG